MSTVAAFRLVTLLAAPVAGFWSPCAAYCTKKTDASGLPASAMEVGAHPPWFWNAFDPTQIAQLAVSLRLLNRWILFEDTNETHPGRVAEWLGRALQKLLQRFESALDLQTAIGSLHFRLRLLVPKGFNRIQGRCLGRGIIPRHQPHQEA